MKTTSFPSFRVIGALLMAVAFLSVSCVPVMNGDDPPARVPPAQRVDPPTTPITAPSVDAEQTVSTGDFLGQVVLLDFWATWSEQSMAERADIAALHDDFAERGFTVVGLVVDRGEPDDVRAKLSNMQFDYPVMIVSSDKLRSYGSRSVPTRVLLDAQGDVVETFPGAVSFESIRAQIEELL